MRNLKKDLILIKEKIPVNEQMNYLPVFLQSLMEISRQDTKNITCPYEKRLKLKSYFECTISYLMDKNPAKQNLSLYKNEFNEKIVIIEDEEDSEEYIFKLNFQNDIEQSNNKISLIHINKMKNNVTILNQNNFYKMVYENENSNSLKQTTIEKQFLSEIDNEKYIIRVSQEFQKKKLSINGNYFNCHKIFAENINKNSNHEIIIYHHENKIVISHNKDNFYVLYTTSEKFNDCEFTIIENQKDYSLGLYVSSDNGDWEALYNEEFVNLQFLFDKLDLFSLENDFSIDINYISDSMNCIINIKEKLNDLRNSKKTIEEKFLTYLNLKDNHFNLQKKQKA